MKYLVSTILIVLSGVALFIGLSSFPVKYNADYFRIPAGNFAGYEYVSEYRLTASNYDYALLKDSEVPELRITSKDGQTMNLFLLSTLYFEGNAQNSMETFGFLKSAEDDTVVNYVPKPSCKYLIIPVRVIPGEPFGSVANSKTIDSHKYMLDFNVPQSETKIVTTFDYISCFEF